MTRLSGHGNLAPAIGLFRDGSVAASRLSCCKRVERVKHFLSVPERIKFHKLSRDCGFPNGNECAWSSSA